MFAARKTDGAVATTANYIEEVFSTYLYTGNGAAQTIPNGIAIGDDSGGSVYFGGTGYLQTPSALLNSSSSFTFECWAYWNSTGSSSDMGMLTSQYASGGAGRFLFGSQSGALVLRVNGGTVYLTTSVSTGIWYHIAWTFDGTTHRLFKDGVLSDSSTTVPSLYTGANTSLGGQSDTLLSGYKLNGFISNARILSGTALYTSGFTPPTAPLTAITNTSLLTCQTPNTVLDYSTNAYTITVNGNAVAQNGGGPFTDSTANKGGMVWLKGRSGSTDHALYDTARGATFDLVSNSSAAQTTQTTGLTAFNSNGFSIGALAKLNTNAATYTSWTFRKQAKFFDVVTYTGNGSNRAIAHNLGSVPGCIMVKRTNTTGAWAVYHRSLANTEYLVLNTTAAKATGATYWNSTTPTSTEFSLGTSTDVNASGGTYVAYLFAHDAGGFGAAGTDNVISCGSYTGTGVDPGPVITLGYEPQWLIIKRATGGTGTWQMYDIMRGMPDGANPAYVDSNTSSAEASSGWAMVSPLANGFRPRTTDPWLNASGSTYIYIAIRRGPMKTPTSGTSVFSPVVRTGTGASATVTGVGFPPDYAHIKSRSATAADGRNHVIDRLRGGDQRIFTDATSAESSVAGLLAFGMDGVTLGTAVGVNANTESFINYFIRRAPGFFDVVCYTGTGSPTTVTHNLGVEPELIITKRRDSAYDWVVYSKTLGGTKVLFLNTTDAEVTFTGIDTVTSTTFKAYSVLQNGNQVAYLFATVTGVSKVGSYTGNGGSQTINCGFAAGARFILIKRTDSTGDWYVWDTARGIVSGNDPRLSLNTTAAEVTTDDSIDPDNSGFIVNQLSATNINVSSATYIFWAVA